MLAICVPVRDTVHSEFAFCLSQLIAALTRNNVEHQLFFENGSMIADQRRRLVEVALERSAQQILWLDSDMMFPANIYRKLDEHNVSVVACTYSTRTPPYRNVASGLSGNTGLQFADAVGMGCMLVDTEVYHQIPRPWFNMIWDDKTQTFSGEDVYFCEELIKNRYNVMVDCDTSKQCSHIGSVGVKLGNIND